MDNEIQHTSFRCAITKTNIIIAEFIDAASAIVEIILPGHDYVCVKQVIKSENCLSVIKIMVLRAILAIRPRLCSVHIQSMNHAEAAEGIPALPISQTAS